MSGVFGVVALFLPTVNPRASRLATHVFLPTGEGVSVKEWEVLHPGSSLLAHGRSKWSVTPSPSGRKLLVLVPGEDLEVPGEPRRKTLDLVVVDALTASEQSTGFTAFSQVLPEPSIEDLIAHASGTAVGPPQERRREITLKYARSPDDQRYLVAATHTVGTARHLTLAVVDAQDHTVRGERTSPGHAVTSQDALLDLPVQWSPNGRRLAVQVREPHPVWEWKSRDSLFVLAADLATSFVLENTSLVGSLSWSPDSRSLSVEHDERVGVLDVDSGRFARLPWLPERRNDPPTAAQVVGLLPGDRVLLMRRTRTPRLRLVAADVATGKGPLLAAIPTDERNEYARPTLTRRWEEFADGS